MLDLAQKHFLLVLLVASICLVVSYTELSHIDQVERKGELLEASVCWAPYEYLLLFALDKPDTVLRKPTSPPATIEEYKAWLSSQPAVTIIDCVESYDNGLNYRLSLANLPKDAASYVYRLDALHVWQRIDEDGKIDKDAQKEIESWDSVDVTDVVLHGQKYDYEHPSEVADRLAQSAPAPSAPANSTQNDSLIVILGLSAIALLTCLLFLVRSAKRARRKPD